ncbi:MAG: hypothetical protein KKI08_11650 [Armatimonadetes bacterium]|nr:hypothetical protein [Armatimonadota bacterium]
MRRPLVHLLGVLLLVASCDSSSVVQDGATDLALDHGGRETGADGPAPDVQRVEGPAADTPVNPPLIGVYSITGTDTNGSYSGTAEVRPATAGKLTLHHVQIYDSATFEGDRMALAWEGEVVSDSEPYRFRVTLERVGWIATYGSTSRASVDPTPVTFEGDFTRTGGTIAGSFAPKAGSLPAFSETWTWKGAGGAEPIWHNRRTIIAGHAPLSAGEKSMLFSTFSTFHDLPAVKPYVSDPRFQQLMHSWVLDPTDHDFYQQAANADVLRVIQRVVDPISLVEARVRNRAYRQRLADKAAHYDQEVPAEHINSAGMYGFYDTVNKKHLPDGDALEWTGDYVASQALRYLATKQQVALDNMLESLAGIVLCYDIVPKKGDFARTLREHVDDGSPIWVRGLPPHEAYDWMVGGNNDMLKGIQHGFFWAFLALDGLSGHDALKQKMAQILRELLSDNPDAGDKLGNEIYIHLLLYVMTADLTEYALYLGMYLYLKPWLVDWGNGSTYAYGISDWSGNYMNIKTLVCFYLMEQFLQKKGQPVFHLAEYKQALTSALVRMRNTQLGFYQLTAATLGDFATPPPELDQALWVLRGFPAPKVHHDIDWRLNPDFCISPVPNLPWKLDWAQPGEDRTHSLTIYPLLERQPSNIEWKELPGSYTGKESSVRSSGPEYLYAYWFGRYFGSITPAM